MGVTKGRGWVCSAPVHWGPAAPYQEELPGAASRGRERPGRASWQCLIGLPACCFLFWDLARVITPWLWLQLSLRVMGKVLKGHGRECFWNRLDIDEGKLMLRGKADSHLVFFGVCDRKCSLDSFIDDITPYHLHMTVENIFCWETDQSRLWSDP